MLWSSWLRAQSIPRVQTRKHRRGRRPDHAAQKTIGENMRAQRLSGEMTQEELAELCDLHPTEIGRLERGERDIRLSTLMRVARGLQVSPSALLDGIE